MRGENSGLGSPSDRVPVESKKIVTALVRSTALAPSPRPSTPMFDRRPLSGALLLAALGLGLVSSCDNPTCVFVDGCTGSNGGNGPGGLGNNGATFPADGAFMSAGAPTLVAAAPQIQDLHPRSPLFLEFSESLSPDGLSEAFRVLDVVGHEE